MKRLAIIVIVFLSLIFLVGNVSATTYIDSCQSLSGSDTYILNASLSANGTDCITISANNIVLDCADYTITGNDTTGTYGIYANAKSNLEIKNCHVIDFWQGIGIYSSTSNFNLTDSIIESCTNTGIYLSQLSSGINIRNVTANSNNLGFYVPVSSGIYFTNIYLDSNINTGITLQDTNNTVFVNLTASNNGNGIGITSHSYNNTFSNMIIIDSGTTGLTLSLSENNTIYNSFFNNTNNIGCGSLVNYLNTTKQDGTRIYSNGNKIGGNYWTNPSGTGYSDTCTDADTDGFCDSPFECNENNIDYLPLSSDYIEKIFVDSCQTLSTSGGYYKMNASIESSSSTCFTFSANNITLDCGGYIINMTATSNVFDMNGVANAIIKNCIVHAENSDNNILIYTESVDNFTFQNNSIYIDGISWSGDTTDNVVNIIGNYFNQTCYDAVQFEPSLVIMGQYVNYDNNIFDGYCDNTSYSGTNTFQRLNHSTITNSVFNIIGSADEPLTFHQIHGNLIDNITINATNLQHATAGMTGRFCCGTDNIFRNSRLYLNWTFHVYGVNALANNLTWDNIYMEATGNQLQMEIHDYDNVTIKNSIFKGIYQSVYGHSDSPANNTLFNLILDNITSDRYAEFQNTASAHSWNLTNSYYRDGVSLMNVSDSFLLRSNYLNDSSGYNLDLDSYSNNNIIYNNTFDTGDVVDSGTGNVYCVNETGNTYLNGATYSGSSFGTCFSPYITSCQTLSTENITYYLNASISDAVGTCITIGADNIIFDCAGYEIDGDSSGSDYGIYANGVNNVSIINCSIKDFEREVYFNLVTDIDIKDTAAHCNSFGTEGFYLYSSNNIILENLYADDCTFGSYRLVSVDYIITENITSNGGTGSGIYMENVNHLLVDDFDIYDNPVSSGIDITQSGYYNNITFKNGYMNNNYYCLSVGNVLSGTFENIYCNYSVNRGMNFYRNNTDITLKNISVFYSRYRGIEFTNSGGTTTNIVIDGATIGNNDGSAGYGIYIGSPVTGVTIKNAEFFNNTRYEIFFDRINNTYIENVLVHDSRQAPSVSTAYPIYYAGLSKNHILKNVTVRDNQIGNYSVIGIRLVTGYNATLENIKVFNLGSLTSVTYICTGIEIATYNSSIIDGAEVYNICTRGLSVSNDFNNIIKNSYIHSNDGAAWGTQEIRVNVGTGLTQFCDNTFDNVTISGNLPYYFYNYTATIENVTAGSIDLCDADNSVIKNVTIIGGMDSAAGHSLRMDYSDGVDIDGVTINSGNLLIYYSRNVVIANVEIFNMTRSLITPAFSLNPNNFYQAIFINSTVTAGNLNIHDTPFGLALNTFANIAVYDSVLNATNGSLRLDRLNNGYVYADFYNSRLTGIINMTCIAGSCIQPNILNLYNTTYDSYDVNNATSLNIFWNLLVSNTLGANVVIRNETGEEVASFSDSRNVWLMEFFVTPLNIRTNSTPHAITLTKSGYEPNGSAITMDTNKEFTVYMTASHVPVIDQLPDITGNLVVTIGFGIMGLFSILPLLYFGYSWKDPEMIAKIMIAAVIIILMVVAVWQGIVL